MSLFEELKRRSVFKVAVAYIIVAWLLLQVSDVLVPALLLPDWFHSGVAFLLIIGFPVALIFAWAFELTPEGLKSDKSAGTARSGSSGPFLNRTIVIALVVALGWFAWDKFGHEPAEDTVLAGDATAPPAQPTASSEAPVESGKSIVVLPFVNMSSDPEQEYFADGISEELLNLLAHTPNLRVISRTSAFSFKGKDVDIPTIAERLGVSHVLEGSVRKAGNTIRITAQLIETASDAHIWSSAYDRSLDDIFAVQDEVAAEVVKQLELHLFESALRATQLDPRAYSLFLQARQMAVLEHEEDRPRIRSLLEQALSIEPDYADALFLLSSVAEDESLSKQYLERAIALEPDNPRIKSFMAIETAIDNSGLYATAARMLEEAAATDPYEPQVLFNAARVAGFIGKMDLAIRLYEYIAERDPLFFWAQLNLGSAYFDTGRGDEAVRQFEVALGLNQSEGAVRWKLGLAKVLAGDYQGALDHFAQEDDPVYRFQGQAIAWHHMGRAEESAAAMRELETLEVFGQPIPEAWPWGLARAYAWMGDADRAFHYMEKTREAGYMSVFAGLAVSPQFESLHEDERWEPFLRSVKQLPEQVEAFEFNFSVPD